MNHNNIKTALANSSTDPGVIDFAFARAMLGVVLAESAPRLENALGEMCRGVLGGDEGFCLLHKSAVGLSSGRAVPEAWQVVVQEAEQADVLRQRDGKIACPVRSGNTLLGMLAVSGKAFTPGDMERLQTVADLLAEILDTRLSLDSHRKDLLQSDEQVQQQRQIIDRIHDSVVAMDLGGYITSWNKGAEMLFGYSAEEAIGRNILFLYADENEEDALLNEIFSGQHSSREMVVRRRKKSGEVFWASLSLSLSLDSDGNPANIVGYLVDVTDRLRSEEQLRLQAAIFECSDEGILVTDARNRIVSINQAFTKITGYTTEESVGKTPQFLRSGHHDDDFYDEIRQSIAATGHWVGELWNCRKSGEPFPAWQSTSAVHNQSGEVTHYFSMFTDITERKDAEQKIHQLAYYDLLTGLPNRAMLLSLLGQSLMEAKRSQSYGAILFIDLDRFKQVNDSLGPAMGDKLLLAAAQLIKSCLRSEDVLARVGGDEFVVALFDISRREHASIVAEKIIGAMSEAVSLGGGHELHISASIGISVFPEDGDDPETLIRHADVAMSRVKQSRDGGPYLFFSQEMNQRAQDRLRLEVNLRKALERDELSLHFQPQLNLHTGKIVGAEVLLRWRHPEMGMVSPGVFIPVAEETGLIIAIGDWILETVCQKNKAWQEAGLPIVKLAVNLSARQFRPTLPQHVQDILGHSGLDPKYLELEITESMVMHNTEDVIELMDNFKVLGVSISLDDFGTGYSSLNYLKRFPIDKLKIDQSFIRGLPGDSSDCAIARTVIDLSKNLNLHVIAEGVETLEQQEFLKTIGCDEIQGYYYSRPVPEEDFIRFLQQANNPQ